jgi:hypothetical protein
MIARRNAIRLGSGILAGFLLGWGGFGLSAGDARAAEAAPPPLLVVSGLIGPAEGAAGGNPPPPRPFSLQALEALGTVELTTTTPWTKGPQTFTGVPLQRLLEAVGARGTLLRLSAINDFHAELPVSDARDYGVLLATRQAGRPMRIRDFGPIWIVYPWSDRPDIDRPGYHRRSVWQLARIEVR